jgi:hypothetical protein
VRYIVYLLVLANVAFFAWHWYAPAAAPQAAGPPPLPRNVDRLVLLSERPPEPAPQADTPKETVAEPRAAQQIPAGTPAQGVNPPGEPVRVAEPAEGEAPAPPAQVQPARSCWTIGPISKKRIVTALVEGLSPDDYLVNVRTADVREPAGYWVYMPSMPRSEARRIVADLDAHGMKDYYIGKQNYLSLGIFSDEKKAERRRREVKRYGYDALVEARFRTREAHWIDIEGQGDALADSDAWQEITTQYADLSLEDAECE